MLKILIWYFGIGLIQWINNQFVFSSLNEFSKFLLFSYLILHKLEKFELFVLRLKVFFNLKRKLS